jgi:iron complex outermembrane receptor protein
LLLLTPVLAHAQASSPSATAAAPASTGLTEIVVTARKQTENLVTVPVSVSALSAQDLQARGIAGYLTLQQFTPGFKFINQSVNKNERGYISYMMRGMNPGTPVSYQQDVSIFIDGAPVAGGAVTGLQDVTQVEVIKGPQSAYFGRASFAGAVNFITRTPSFTPQGKIDASYGSFGIYDATASAEGGIFRDVLAGRLALRTYHSDGQYANPEVSGQRLGAQDTRSISGELLFKPIEKLSIRVYGKYWTDEDGPAATGILYPSQYNCNATQAGYTVSNLQFVGGKNYFCGTLPTFTTASLSQMTTIPSVYYSVLNARTQAGLGGTLGYTYPGKANKNYEDHFGIQRIGQAYHSIFHYDVGSGFSLDGNVAHHENVWGFLSDLSTKNLLNTPNPNYGSALPQYNSTNVPGGLLPYSASLGRGTLADRDASAEIRLTTPQDKRLRGMVGFSYYNQQSKLVLVSYSNAGFNQNSAGQQQLASTPSVFGSITLDILHNLNLSFEAREQWDSIEAKVPANLLDFKATFASFAPRAILSYHPTESSTIYASYAQGVRPGVFNNSFASLAPAYQAQITAVAPVSLAVPEEKVSMYEVGYKNRFFDNRAQIVAAAYYGDWTGRHILDKVYYTDNTNTLQNVLFTVAGGETLLYGLELEGKFEATHQLLFEGTFDYAGTNIRKDYCSDCLLITGNPTPQGTSMPGYPTLTGSFSTTYTRHAFKDFDGYVRADYIFTGKVYIDDSNVANTGDSSKLNLHFGIRNGRYKLEFYGTNITNDKTYTYGQRYSDGLPQAGSGLTASPPVNEVSVSPADKPMYGVHFVANF